MEAEVSLPRGIPHPLCDLRDLVTLGFPLDGTNDQGHEIDDLYLGGEDGILRDEPDLTDHLQRVEDVDGPTGDGGAGREVLHGTVGALHSQD